MPFVFTEPDTWTGGSVELEMLLDSREPSSAVEAVAAAWDWDALDGPYATNTQEPFEQAIVSIRDADLEALSNLYGTGRLPNSTVAAFSGGTILDEDGVWIYFGLPVGGLSRCYPVGAFPFSGSARDPWVVEVYGWLMELARWTAQSVAVRAGVIGWLTLHDSEELLTGRIPKRRYHGYLRPEADGLAYFAPNIDEPLAKWD